MTKKIFLLLIIGAVLIPVKSVADEGMWLVNLFESSIYPQMVKKGLKLKAKEIYNEADNSAITNAIVSLDFGCTGSMISNSGLLITNHHCAYGDIHSLSTPEKNYLEDGFWALKQADEKPIKGKNALFLRKVLDVTDEVKEEVATMQKEGFKGMMMRRVFKNVENRYKKGTDNEIICASMWNGTKYYIFFYDVYTDVRLVGAPPVSIGAFGAEADNWGWPQHKGDFALYRVYGDKNGRPAVYSADNQPITPKRVLNISVKGVREGDYVMIMGYPGRTNRYVSSFEVKEKQEIINPIVTEIRRAKLDVWKRHMDADPVVRLKYSDNYFSISNYTDYAKWENKCFIRYDVVGIREQEEKELAKWINSDPKAAEKYGKLLENMKKGFDARVQFIKDRAYFRDSWASVSEVVQQAKRFSRVTGDMEKEGMDKLSVNDKLFQTELKAADHDLYKVYDLATDRELFEQQLAFFLKYVSPKLYTGALAKWKEEFNGDAKRIADYVFDNSVYTTREKFLKYFETPRTKEEILSDPAVQLAMSSSIQMVTAGSEKINKELGYDPESLTTQYGRALYQMKESKGISQYPDANSTMRISYGTVGGLVPSDGITYSYRTTINGYREKKDQSNYEFKVNARMDSLMKAKDWGRWGEKGELYTDFLTNTDITGGNSGSPVMNSKGELIGLAFDGNRESMSGDAYYHPVYFKTVNVDIRFVLWVIDKYAGAGKLIDEMNIVIK
ncbi:MAG: S46 family peptidase [Bacteroidales bacterium]